MLVKIHSSRLAFIQGFRDFGGAKLVGIGSGFIIEAPFLILILF